MQKTYQEMTQAERSEAHSASMKQILADYIAKNPNSKVAKNWIENKIPDFDSNSAKDHS